MPITLSTPNEDSWISSEVNFTDLDGLDNSEEAYGIIRGEQDTDSEQESTDENIKSSKRKYKQVSELETENSKVVKRYNLSHNPKYDPKIEYKKGHVNDPYKMYPPNVHINHFYDARLYDTDAEPGFLVQSKKAKREYYKWLLYVRKRDGWENFRVLPKSKEKIDKSITYIGGSVGVTVDKYGQPIPEPVSNTTENKPHNPKYVAQSTEKGITVDDDDYRPKMFTNAMGHEISVLRLTKKMKQEDLAMKLNVDVGTIRSIEKGTYPFNSESALVKKMAEVLGVPSIAYH